LEEAEKFVRGIRGINADAASTKYRPASQQVRGYSGWDADTGAVSQPIYQSALFVHPAFDRSTGFGYGRYGNPTRLELEDTLALLEHGLKSWAFSTGMAAESILLKLFSPGDHVVVSNDLYGGTYRLFTEVYGKYGLEFSYVDTSDTEVVKGAVQPNTKAAFIETPSNPMMKVTDIQAVADIIHERGGLLIVDNTFLSPHFQTPIDFGADIVVHSGTKYLGGHNDTLSGFIVIAHEKLIEPIFYLSMAEGGVLSPLDSWLMLRSLKTLGLRMDRQQENALVIVDFLKAHPKVDAVYYVGDPEHPAYELSKRQATGFGGMVSFSLKDAGEVPHFINSLKFVLFAESLGGTETLLTFPFMQTHGDIPEAIRLTTGVDERLLRLSVGIEDVRDIIDDLELALLEGRPSGAR
jgi:cystathionine gamma-synthase